jgi:hypothetical protein
MPTSTYTPIYTTTLGSAQASVTFNSFSGYTDLIIVAQSKITPTGSGSMWFQANGDTATNYSDTLLTGNGSAATSFRHSNVDRAYYGDASNTDFQTTILQFQNYSNTTTYKTALIRSNVTSSTLSGVVAMWRSTSAITSITLGTNSTTLIAGSTFTLYGILAA